MIIKASLNVTKIDKARLFKGKKGTYLNIILLENKNGPDQYDNDGMVIQGVSDEERKRGVQGEILGNFKVMVSNPAPDNQSSKSGPDPEVSDDEVPF